MTTTTHTNPALDPAALLGSLENTLAGIFEAMEWAEDEIERAAKRHPQAWDLLYHSFILIRPRDGMELLTRTEPMMRAHSRELLERVAAGQDTRLATDAEICVAMSEVSQITMIRPEAAGLYARAFGRVFKDSNPWAEREDHYEALYAGEIDELEAMTRHKLADRERVLDPKDCTGTHHGEPAPSCRFSTGQAPEPPAPLDLDAELEDLTIAERAGMLFA